MFLDTGNDDLGIRGFRRALQVSSRRPEVPMECFWEDSAAGPQERADSYNERYLKPSA